MCVCTRVCVCVCVCVSPVSHKDRLTTAAWWSGGRGRVTCVDTLSLLLSPEQLHSSSGGLSTLLQGPSTSGCWGTAVCVTFRLTHTLATTITTTHRNKDSKHQHCCQVIVLPLQYVAEVERLTFISSVLHNRIWERNVSNTVVIQRRVKRETVFVSSYFLIHTQPAQRVVHCCQGRHYMVGREVKCKVLWIKASSSKSTSYCGLYWEQDSPIWVDELIYIFRSFPALLLMYLNKSMNSKSCRQTQI